MKKISLILLMLIPLTVYSEPLPEPVPKPTLILQKAIKLATQSLEMELLNSKSAFKHKDFIIRSISYTNYFDNKTENEWSWEIIFFHVIATDITYSYKVMQSGKVLLIKQTI